MGKKRAHNEDAFAIHEEQGLFIMCDGMGGHASGEVASQLAVEEIGNFFLELCRDSTFDWPYDLDEDQPFAARALEGSILYANDRIFVESMKNSELEGMGTTVCAMATAGEQMAIAHVGDSRVYRYRDNTLTQITEDHSLINHYRRLGELSEADLEALGKKKNVIVRALGLKDEVEVDVTIEDVEPGDIFLVCSDGLTDCAADWLIEQAIGNYRDDLEGGVKRLVDLANDGGGKDNITVLLVQIDGPQGRQFEWTPTIPEATPRGAAGPLDEEPVGRDTTTVPVEQVIAEARDAHAERAQERSDTMEPPVVPSEDQPKSDDTPPPLSQRKRLKIVVSSGEVDLLGESPLDEDAQSDSSASEDESQGRSKTSWNASRVVDPELRHIMEEALPGLVPGSD